MHNVRTGLALLALSLSMASANAMDVQVRFTNVSGGSADTQFNEQRAREIVSASLPGMALRFVKTAPDSGLWLQYTFHYLYLPQDATRVNGYALSVRNEQGHELCGLGGLFWWRGSNGPGELRDDLSRRLIEMHRSCGVSR